MRRFDQELWSQPPPFNSSIEGSQRNAQRPTILPHLGIARSLLALLQFELENQVILGSLTSCKSCLAKGAFFFKCRSFCSSLSRLQRLLEGTTADSGKGFSGRYPFQFVHKGAGESRVTIWEGLSTEPFLMAQRWSTWACRKSPASPAKRPR